MDSQQNVTNQGAGNNYPSVHYLACPKCKKKDFKIIGTKGSKAAAVGVGMAFGAIGSLVANAANKDDFSLKPVQYKCTSCGNKFESLPLVAQPEEILEVPCTINFNRLSAVTGMAVAQDVWMNGVKMGSVGNGKTLTFQTNVRYNTIFVSDHYGVAFKGDYKFEAQSGGTVDVNFKRKFV